MSGEFFDRPEPPHKCALPDVEVASGRDGWRCDCGRAYLRELLSQHGETWWQWRRDATFDRTKS